MSKLRRIIDRMRPGEDIGLDHNSQAGRQRTINADGSFNLERKTGKLFGNFTLYHWLITASWTKYWVMAFSFYGVINTIFAFIYYWVGVSGLDGIPVADNFTKLLYCFFFSVQSFTTVGYGGIHPVGVMSNFVASFEAFFGLMTFALATGTLYGRFSKPTSRIVYSKNIIIAPFNEGTSMQLMVANQLNSPLMEMEAKVNISWSEDEGNGKTIRRFQQVKLQVDRVVMFPVSWVLNHPIDEESILYGRTLEEINKMQIEVFVLLKGFEDTFSQIIYSRQSYTSDQFIYGARFRRPFYLNEEGKTVMDLTKVGDYDVAPIQIAELTG